MFRITATAPDGTEWFVRVRWQHRWRLLARRFGGWRPRSEGSSLLDQFRPRDVSTRRTYGTASESDRDLFFYTFLLVVVLIVGGAILWWVVLPLLLLLIDTVVVAALVAVAVPPRILRRRPWRVEAVLLGAEDEEPYAVDVVGYLAAMRTRATIADGIRLGRIPSAHSGPV